MKIDSLFDPILNYHLEKLGYSKDRGFYKNMSTQNALREYGTVRLDIGRQTGKAFTYRGMHNLKTSFL